ncbi:MAG: type II toxin-antitoxin system RelE/ParE family toxin [Methylovirgula sp.]|jgi:proteic killer suppression protein
MIKSFLHKGLAELFSDGATKHINRPFHARIIERLDVMDAAAALRDLNVPGYDFHQLKGHKPPRYSIHVNGPWCLTFEFDGTDLLKVDFEQYH